MLEKNEILIVILALLITFYLVIAMGAKQKTKSNQFIHINKHLNISVKIRF